MKRWRFMVIAGESSGDMLGAELVTALRARIRQGTCIPENASSVESSAPLAETEKNGGTLAPRFFGAGGPHLAAAGVDLELDLTTHAVIGLVLKRYFEFRKIFQRLKELALRERPDALLLIDFSGFNRRFARSIRKEVARVGPFFNWAPKIVQYVSPQVWASREGRARQMERDYDLLLTIFPFEKDWYAQRTPKLRVRFVGHPVIDRYRHRTFASPSNDQRLLLLLPGSRRSEIERHVPILLGATRLIREKAPQLQIRMVLPNESMAALANRYLSNSDGISVQAGGLAESLSIATAAIASTGTVTIECAYFGVPTVAMYVVSGATYQIGKRLIKVPYLAMPNLLGREVIFPELIQEAASPQNIAREALELVSDATRRITIKNRLQQVIAALGPPGAADRAAAEIFALLAPQVGRSLPK